MKTSPTRSRIRKMPNARPMNNYHGRGEPSHTGAYRPYSFHRRPTNALVASSISNSFGHAPHLPLGGQFYGRVEAHLAAGAQVRAGVVEDVDGAADDLGVARGSQLLNRWNSTSCSSWTFTCSSTTTMNLVNAICPAPQIACITRRAW